MVILLGNYNNEDALGMDWTREVRTMCRILGSYRKISA